MNAWKCSVNKPKNIGSGVSSEHSHNVDAKRIGEQGVAKFHDVWRDATIVGVSGEMWEV